MYVYQVYIFFQSAACPFVFLTVSSTAVLIKSDSFCSFMHCDIGGCIQEFIVKPKVMQTVLLELIFASGVRSVCRFFFFCFAQICNCSSTICEKDCPSFIKSVASWQTSADVVCVNLFQGSRSAPLIGMSLLPPIPCAFSLACSLTVSLQIWQYESSNCVLLLQYDVA